MEHFRHTLILSVSPAAVYSSLTDIAGLRAWWTQDCNGSADANGTIHFRFGPVHKEMQVKHLEANREVRWVCTKACIDVPSLARKDEWVGTEMVFRLTDEGNGRTRIDFEHVGLAPSFECYGMCVKGWQYYLGSLQKYLEAGEGTPHLAGAAHTQCQERAAA